MIEVKWALKFLDYTYCKILVSFLSLEETLVFLSFLSFLTFQNSREKRPFESKISSFFIWRTWAAVQSKQEFCESENWVDPNESEYTDLLTAEDKKFRYF